MKIREIIEKEYCKDCQITSCTTKYSFSERCLCKQNLDFTESLVNSLKDGIKSFTCKSYYENGNCDLFNLKG